MIRDDGWRATSEGREVGKRHGKTWVPGEEEVFGFSMNRVRG